MRRHAGYDGEKKKKKSQLTSLKRMFKILKSSDLMLFGILTFN